MNIQVFGTKKSFDTKKAQRYFKERRVKFQFIDLAEKGMSKGELESVRRAVGGIVLADTVKPDSAAAIADMKKTGVREIVMLTGDNETAAQAVAAHSWLIYQIRHGVSTPSVGLASSYSSEISSAVESVKDVLVKYNGDVANTAYGSCAAEKTNSAANMGWGNYAYLVSVDSAFEQKFAPSQYYPRATTIKQETMRSNVIKMVGETVFKAYESRPESWITEIHTDANGYVDYAVVCGQRITGGRF